ncbi:LacI family DNA-binding transcriptional regulator [Robbsia sp. KACC 23696]|uniref:LacI family DNA-binding transcriptional regulator n=1 Tax=Robbsia sp. KACC 23696 TaxID=3149231 RepID=UPI00325B5567
MARARQEGAPAFDGRDSNEMAPKELKTPRGTGKARQAKRGDALTVASAPTPSATSMPMLAATESGEQVTLIDVARVAGVAPMTVSRALNRPELVRDATQQKVLAAVRATGYVPNLLAGSLASNRSRLVAVLLPTIASAVFADTVQALIARLHAANYQTLLGLTEYAAHREEALLEAILGRRPDGVVLAGTDHTALTIARLKQARIPVVEMWDLNANPIDTIIGFSHEAVGIAVARHLFQKGYRRFGIVSVDDPRGLRRSRSAMAELQSLASDHVAMEILAAPATMGLGREGLRRLLDRGNYDAVLCSSDTLAAGVLAEAASRGIAVPVHLGVMGFGDLSAAAHLYPSLSTVRVDGRGIGERVATTLLHRFGVLPAPADCAPADDHRNTIDTGFDIIDRDSTRVL